MEEFLGSRVDAKRNQIDPIEGEGSERLDFNYLWGGEYDP